jgi:SAM-dependent methyltransferase
MALEDREHWDAKHAGRPRLDAAPAPFLVAHAGRLPVGRTLDVAAGTGRNSRFLSGLGHRVVAIDVSAVGLRALRADAPAVACAQMDLDRPGVRPASCDAVVIVSFLDRRLLDVVVDWLRPGGVVLWDTFLREQRDVGHPRNPDWLLARGELRERLAPRCDVLAEREGLVDEPGGRAFRSGVVARRRG